jgi:DNA-binding response OmpR family regulator
MSTVLVVSGDTAFRKQLRALFNHGNGFDAFVEAGNAVEAMAKAKRRSPNLAVLDFSLPDTGVSQLVQKLKASKPELPIFLLTTDYSVYTEKKALSCGITAVFSKLDDLATLLANARAVCRMMRRTEARQDTSFPHKFGKLGPPRRTCRA